MTESANLGVASQEALEADLLVVGCFESEAPPVEALPATLVREVRALSQRPGWVARRNRTVESGSDRDATGVATVVLRGLGKRDELDRFRLARWIEATVGAALSAGMKSLAVALPPHDETTGEQAAERSLRQLAAASYRYRRFLGEEAAAKRLSDVALLPPEGQESVYADRLEAARAVAEGMELCRDLGNSPGNLADPSWMEKRARRLAEETGAEIEVLGTEELEKRGMNAILAVGAGSVVPPRIVRLSIGTEGPAVALVGKGITFDTGGISIKPSSAMEEMKYDKCGACTVLGVFKSVASLALPIRLTAYLALAENMPDGKAYRPGDIVRTYSGKTVEIINTDAEGRMVLADTLAWAAERKPDWMLEYSTLTGACVVALGHAAAGLFTPDDELAGGLLAAAERTGERLWRMPFWPEYLETMRGSHSDLKNAGGRWGGANSAAAFLGEFVGDVEHWGHLDIAGPAALSGKEGVRAEGATGYGVSFTVDWLRGLL